MSDTTTKANPNCPPTVTILDGRTGPIKTPPPGAGGEISLIKRPPPEPSTISLLINIFALLGVAYLCIVVTKKFNVRLLDVSK